MPSNHLILCHPLLLSSIFLSIRVFSSESTLHIMWPKYWSFRFRQCQSFQWVFRIDFLQNWLVWPPCCAYKAVAVVKEPETAPPPPNQVPPSPPLWLSPTLCSLWSLRWVCNLKQQRKESYHCNSVQFCQHLAGPLWPGTVYLKRDPEK